MLSMPEETISKSLLFLSKKFEEGSSSNRFFCVREFGTVNAYGT